VELYRRIWLTTSENLHTLRMQQRNVTPEMGWAWPSPEGISRDNSLCAFLFTLKPCEHCANRVSALSVPFHQIREPNAGGYLARKRRQREGLHRDVFCETRHAQQETERESPKNDAVTFTTKPRRQRPRR
jgi:hypothetical protein